MNKLRKARPCVAESVALDYRIRFDTSVSLASLDEQDPVIDIVGRIVHIDNDEKETEAGELRGAVVRIGRVINDGYDFFEACDAHSQELSNIAELVWDRDTDEYREDLVEGACGDLIVPATLKILPEHRGKGVGLLAIWRFLDYFGSGAALAILTPFPMNHSDERGRRYKIDLAMSYESFKTTKAVGIEKLARHWGRLGFRRVARDPDYMSLDMQLRRPSLEDLIKR